jgi:single-strand DNA-binding protein
MANQSMNSCTFTGNLGKDVEVKKIRDTTVANFSIAVNLYARGEEKTLWIRCSLWGKQAESKLPQYLKKGQQVCVSGQINLNEWTTDDGTARADLQLNVRDLALVGDKNSRQEMTPNQAKSDTSEDIPFD